MRFVGERFRGAANRAGDGALDADAILARMAVTMGQAGDSVVIATTNLKYLARFSGIEAQGWGTVVQGFTGAFAYLAHPFDSRTS